MNSDHRIFLIILVNLVLSYFINQVNAILSAWSIYLVLDSFYLLFAGLYLRGAAGFITITVTAMAVEATLPFPSGIHLIIYIFSFLLLNQTRARSSRESPYQVMGLAFFINLTIFLFFTVSSGTLSLPSPALWLRLFSDLLLSQIVVIILVIPLINGQRHLLLSAGIDVGAEPQSI